MVAKNILPLTGLIFLLLVVSMYLFRPDDAVIAHPIIPARFDKFMYENRQIGSDSVLVEAFLDPIWPHSKYAWEHLKQVLDYYEDRVSLAVHPFPLPYHDNSFLACRALHVVNMLNSSATYDLLDSIFHNQSEFYSRHMFHIPRYLVVNQMMNLATQAVGNLYETRVVFGFVDSETDSLARVSFKYGCSKGVFATPFFFVNGFQLPDVASVVKFVRWRKIIDPLIKKQEKLSIH